MALTPEEVKELEALEKELAYGPGPGQAVPEEVILQEQHPEINMGTRAFLKNFSKSPNASAEYLRQKGFNTKIVDGEVVVKKPQEKEYRVLDPAGFDMQDITDVAYDVPAGVASGVASIAGGLGSLPLGAGIPGAALAGGATSAALEGLRQKIGSSGGIPNNYSAGDVAIQGAAGAAAPLLFGTGASGAQALKAGLSQASQRGLIGRALRPQNYAPEMAQALTGVPAQATRTFADAEKRQIVEALKQPGAYEAFSSNVHDKIRAGLFSAKNKVGEELAEVIKTTPIQVDISPAKAAINSQIQKLEMIPKKNKALVDEIETLKEARDQIFKVTDGTKDEAGNLIYQDLPDVLPATDAFELQAQLKDYANLSNIKPGLQARYGSGASPIEKKWMDASLNAYNKINDGLSEATEGMSKEWKSKYKELSNLQREMASKFSSPERTSKTLSSLDANNNRYTKDLAAKLKNLTGGEVDLDEEAQILEAYKFFGNASLNPLSNQGATSTTRTIGAGGLGAALGTSLGGPVGGAIGLATGAGISNPASLKALVPSASKGSIYLNRAVEPVSEKLGPFAPSTINSIWNMMKQREEQR
jgi:hypothetical protein